MKNWSALVGAGRAWSALVGLVGIGRGWSIYTYRRPVPTSFPPPLKPFPPCPLFGRGRGAGAIAYD